MPDMPPSALLGRAGALASLLVLALPTSAFAQDPAPATPPDLPPAAPTAPAAPTTPATPAPAAPPSDAPAAPGAPTATPLPPSAPPGSDRPSGSAEGDADAPREEGIRLGLDLGFMRAFSGSEDRLNDGSPSLIPIGVDISFRTTPTILWGIHGYAALASRDDCISADSCRARAYAFGGHVETTLGSGHKRSFVPWLRYGLTYEILYQGGAPLDAAGHKFRGAFDFLDLRIGGDFIVSRGSNGKVAGIGPYAGLVGGFLVNQTGVSYVNGPGGQPRDLDRSSGSMHLWMVVGVRGTLDP